MGAKNRNKFDRIPVGCILHVFSDKNMWGGEVLEDPERNDGKIAFEFGTVKVLEVLEVQKWKEI